MENLSQNYNHTNRRLGFSRQMLFLLLCSALWPKAAHAYVDPNAQGLLVQMLTPLLIIATAGATFLRKQVGSTFHWLKGRLRKRK
jgi:hypothetical protein